MPLIVCVAAAVANATRAVEPAGGYAAWLPRTSARETFARSSSGPGTTGRSAATGLARVPARFTCCRDPFTFPAGDLLAHLNQHVPAAVVMGGMAAAGCGRGSSLLFLDDR